MNEETDWWKNGYSDGDLWYQTMYKLYEPALCKILVESYIQYLLNRAWQATDVNIHKYNISFAAALIKYINH